VALRSDWVFGLCAYRDKVVSVFVRFSCAASVRSTQEPRCQGSRAKGMTQTFGVDSNGVVPDGIVRLCHGVPRSRGS
jgi:hypothetical protein